jgi:hypothetical protein
MSTQRARRLPALVIPPRRTRSSARRAPGIPSAATGSRTVTNLGHENDRGQEPDAAHRLESLNNRRHRPLWHDFGQLPLKPIEPSLGVVDGVALFLHHDLMGRMFEALLAQPADMSPRPSFAARKDPIVAEQEQLLALHSQVEHCPLAGSDQVTHGLVRLVGTGVSSPARCRRASVMASRR